MEDINQEILYRLDRCIKILNYGYHRYGVFSKEIEQDEFIKFIKETENLIKICQDKGNLDFKKDICNNCGISYDYYKGMLYISPLEYDKKCYFSLMGEHIFI